MIDGERRKVAFELCYVIKGRVDREKELGDVRIAWNSQAEGYFY